MTGPQNNIENHFCKVGIKMQIVFVLLNRTFVYHAKIYVKIFFIKLFTMPSKKSKKHAKSAEISCFSATKSFFLFTLFSLIHGLGKILGYLRNHGTEQQFRAYQMEMLRKVCLEGVFHIYCPLGSRPDPSSFTTLLRLPSENLCLKNIWFIMMRLGFLVVQQRK